MNAGELCIRRVYTADATESIVAVAQRMARNNVGDLVVVEQTGDGVRPIGIVTDRDLVTRGIALGTPLALELTVRDVMHESLVTAFDDEAVDIVLRRIKQHGIRRIPIVDRAGLLQGILTLDDIVAWIGEQLSNAARLLEDQAAAVS
ncbi:MAG TPA: CBS domain-containing protein [Kofleriaceae bacterium]|nr:CBS domain-containing protein [Kofleriaceae bacterium]